LFSDRLRKTRESLALSQRELNRRCGFSEHTIYQYEAGKSLPSSEHLKVIAEQLHVSTDYLLGLSLDPNKLGDCDLNEDEHDIVDVFRREGWTGLIHLCADRVGKT
jgi:transcriptional regulator with XRE-family HTH domain